MVTAQDITRMIEGFEALRSDVNSKAFNAALSAAIVALRVVRVYF